jgi:hypothetical protein
MIIAELGHGTMSVLCEDLHVLIDPVLTPTFMGGIAAAAPDREIDLAAMPPADLVVVTHFHAGHLEPASLALLDRDTMVAIPDDPTVRGVLEALEFRKVITVAEGSRLDFGDVSVTFTGTGQKFAYVGVLVSAPTGTFWYMGDRGDTLPVARMMDTVAAAGGIDVLVPSHPSDYHSFLLHSTWDGGADENEDHPAWVARTLATAARIAPRLALPQTTSFRYVGRAEWLNRYMFPMRPEEFSTLAATVVDEVGFDYLRPGDAVVLEERVPSVLRDAVPFVRPLPGPENRGLDVTRPVPEVVDDDPDQLGDEELTARIERYLNEDLVAWLATHRGLYRELIALYSRAGFSYRLTAVVPSGRSVSWRVAWAGGAPRVTRLPDGEPPRYLEPHTRIAASTLDRWLRDVMPYFVAAVDTRRSGSLIDIGRTASGAVVANPVEARCLVSAHLMSDRSRLDRWLASEIGRLRGENDHD